MLQRYLFVTKPLFFADDIHSYEYFKIFTICPYFCPVNVFFSQSLHATSVVTSLLETYPNEMFEYIFKNKIKRKISAILIQLNLIVPEDCEYPRWRKHKMININPDILIQ